jgi:hypothetical protein
MKNPPIDPKDLNTIKEVLTSFRTQMCGAADTLGEPRKGQFLALKGDYDKMLSGLPPTDQVSAFARELRPDEPAALEANSQLSCLHAALSSATSLSVMLGSAMASLAGKSAEASAAQSASAVGAEIEKQIAAGTLFKAEGVEVKIAERIKTGDLVAKETCTQLCSAAKDLGLAEGEKKVRAEIAAGAVRQSLITTRKAELQTCGLPIPDARLKGVLAGTGEEFTAAQALAQSRIAALQQRGVALNSNSPLAAKVWLPEEQWQVFESLAVETLKGADPLVTSATPAAGGPPRVMVC